MSSILCETRIKRKRKKKYDAELQMNFRNGFLIACKKDHSSPVKKIIISTKMSSIRMKWMWRGPVRRISKGKECRRWSRLGTSVRSGKPRSPDHRCHHDCHRDKRYRHGHGHHQQHLQDHVFLPEARQPLVPDGGEQLLYIRVGHKLSLGCYHDVSWGDYVADNDLFLSVFNC